MSNETIISFDLDGTLISDAGDDHVWNEAIPEAYADHHGITLSEAKKTVYAEYYKARSIENVDDYTEVHYWVNRLDLASDGDELINMIAAINTAYDDYSALKEVSENHEITLFTNSSRELMEAKLDKLPFNHFKKTVSATTDYNANKRDVETWEQYLADLDTPANTIVHIGDRIVDDVEVPSTLDIDGYQIRRDDDQAKIQSLHDVKNVLPE